jgi:RNA polymerase subunit RPABC4/transcription elongation factor Spt4
VNNYDFFVGYNKMKSENMREDREEDRHSRKIFIKIVVLLISLVINVFLFYILTSIGINPFIVLLLLACMASIVIGSIFRQKKKKSLYVELYSNKERNKIQRPPRKLDLKIDSDSQKMEQNKTRNVDLDFKYSKSLINKCENCGIIITGYKNKCPTCGKDFKLKEVIKKCKTCGMTIPKSVKKCPICGNQT